MSPACSRQPGKSTLLINSALRFFPLHSALAYGPNPGQVEGSEVERVLRKTSSRSGFCCFILPAASSTPQACLLFKLLRYEYSQKLLGGVRRKGKKSSFYLGGCIHRETGLAPGCSCTSAFPFVLLSLAWLSSSASKPSPLLLSFREKAIFSTKELLAGPSGPS